MTLPIETEKVTINPDVQRKPYVKPSVIYEFELEVRAGSPLSPGPDLFDSLLDE